MGKNGWLNGAPWLSTCATGWTPLPVEIGNSARTTKNHPIGHRIRSNGTGHPRASVFGMISAGSGWIIHLTTERSPACPWMTSLD